jgi:NADPH:quinone reductase
VAPAIPETMRALVASSFDGPEALRLVERPVPLPGPGQVLLRVEAAGVNFADVMQTRGLYAGGPKPPYVAGLEACGEVVAVGDGATGPLGRRWMGFGPGAFAEYVAWPAQGLLPLPEGWSAAQGAAFPVQWLTAHGCLRVCGRLRGGESVLIHAAAGGVGTAAVRLAKHYGARVFATASTPEKLDVARHHGADELINYAAEDFVAAVKQRTGGRGVDLVLEMVGGDSFQKNFDAVVPYGRIVVFGAASAQQAVVSNVSLVFKPVEVIGYHLAVMALRRPNLFAAQLAEVTGLIASGVIRPEEPHAYPLAEGTRALQDLDTRKTTGKLVLIP